MNVLAPIGKRVIQFTLKDTLVAIAILAVLLAVFADANRRYESVSVLFNSVENPPKEKEVAAAQNLPYWLVEAAFLTIAPIAALVWIIWRLARKR